MKLKPPVATAKAAVFCGHGKPFELRDFTVPSPGPGELLVRITLSTICGSDVHTWSGKRKEPTPCILGHEIVGTIAGFGEGAPVRDLRGDPLSVGDRITWTLAASCGRCFFCRRGLPQKCESLFKYGHEKVSTEKAFSGGFADYCLIQPGTGVVRLPDSLSDAIAAPANCAVATAAAALRIAGPPAGSTIAVVGCGVLGLFACAIARFRGAANVIGCDLASDRESLALRFGATDFCRPEELNDCCRKHSAGRGADHAIEFSGSPAAVTTAIDCLRTGGSAVIAGTTTPGTPVPLDANQLVRRMISITGLHNYAPEDLVAAVDFLIQSAGRHPFEFLQGRSFRLEQINEAFAVASCRPGTRISILP